MTNYIAFLDSNNVVTHVVQSPDDDQDWVVIWEDKFNCRCIVTTQDGSTHNKYAKSGDSYYEDIDSFIECQPYPSWSLNKAAKQWEPPVAKPEDDKVYAWNENDTNWVVIYDPALDDRQPPAE
jgi:hypothetical protein